jgi:hypothetical protein
MVMQRISLITIGALNLPILRSFYRSLGWEESEISSDRYAVFKTVGVILSLSFPARRLHLICVTGEAQQFRWR